MYIKNKNKNLTWLQCAKRNKTKQLYFCDFLEINAFASAKLYWGIKHINWEQDCLVGDITSLVVSVCGSKQCVENCNYLQCIASKY